jgi:hypothetical protein
LLAAVLQVHEIIGVTDVEVVKVILDDFPLVPARHDEVVEAVARVDVHDVP